MSTHWITCLWVTTADRAVNKGLPALGRHPSSEELVYLPPLWDHSASWWREIQLEEENKKGDKRGGGVSSREGRGIAPGENPRTRGR